MPPITPPMMAPSLTSPPPPLDCAAAVVDVAPVPLPLEALAVLPPLLAPPTGVGLLPLPRTGLVVMTGGALPPAPGLLPAPPAAPAPLVPLALLPLAPLVPLALAPPFCLHAETRAQMQKGIRVEARLV